MSAVFRAAAVYLVLLLLFRISGKRTLGSLTTFDLILTLIISEAVQNALIDNDRSFTNAFLVILTLVGLNILISVTKQRSPWFERLLEGTPTIVYEDGRLHHDRLSKERVDEADIMTAARQLQGLERLDQIKYAIVEKDGHITIIPKRETQG